MSTKPQLKRREYQERSFSDEEKKGLVDYLNEELGTQIDPTTDEIFELVKSGVLFCKLLESIDPATLTGKINEDPKNQFEVNENLDCVIEGSKKLGCNIVNIGPIDFVEGRKHLVLGVFWQIVRVGLLKNVSALSAKFNDLDIGLPPEQILLMWMNHHLKTAGVNRVATNFGDDLKDSEILTHILHQLDPHHCDLSGLEIEDSEERAENVLQNADKLGCRKFVTAEDLCKGNARVNLAFIASLFSKFPEMGLTGRQLQLFEENKMLKKHIEQMEEKYGEQAENLVGEIRRLKTKLKSQKMEKQENEQSYLAEVERLNEVMEQHRRDYWESQKLLKEEMKNLENQYMTEKTAWTEENQALGQQLTTAMERIKELEEEVENLKSVIRQKEKKISSLKKDVANKKTLLEQTTSKLGAEQKAVVDELVLTQGKLKDAELTVKEQEKEIATLHVELGDCKAELLRTFESLGLLEGQKAAVTKLLEDDKKVGFLYKKSPNTKLGIKMQKRFFVLRGEALYYYKTDKEYNTGNRAHPTGVIPLDNTQIIIYSDEQSKRETLALHGWEVKHQDSKRVFILAASCEEEKVVWCDLLQKNTDVVIARHQQSALEKSASVKVSDQAFSRLQSLAVLPRNPSTQNPSTNASGPRPPRTPVKEDTIPEPLGEEEEGGGEERSRTNNEMMGWKRINPNPSTSPTGPNT